MNNRSIKSPHKYYKGVRIIKKATISVITFLLSIPIFMWTTLAEPTNVYNTPYGTYTTDYQRVNSDQYGEITIGPFVIYAVDKNISTFKYQFNNYYTGTVTVNTFTNINPTDSLASYKPELFTDNCTVLSYTNSSVTFYIKNVKEFSATLVYPTGNAQFNIEAWANPGTTNITATPDTQTTVNQILSYVQFINDDSFSIAADMRTVKNKLLDSLGYGSSDDTIETDFDTLISAVNSVGTKLDILHTDLSSMISILNIINQYELSNIILPEQSYAYLIFRNFGTLYNNYNGRFPFYNIDSSVNFQNQFWCNANQDYYLSLRIYNRNQSNLTGLINLVANQWGGSVTKNVIYSDNFNLYSDMTIKFTPSANGYYKITFDSTLNGVAFSPIYFGKALNLSGEMASLTNIPTSGITGIINAIKDVSLNVNNLTVNSTGITYNVNNTQVNNSVNNYNTNINQVYNVENNISADFDTYNQQFTPDFSSSLTALQDTSTMMNGIITQINGIQLFTVPILLTLAGIVLLAILG